MPLLGHNFDGIMGMGIRPGGPDDFDTPHERAVHTILAIPGGVDAHYPYRQSNDAFVYLDTAALAHDIARGMQQCFVSPERCGLWPCTLQTRFIPVARLARVTLGPHFGNKVLWRNPRGEGSHAAIQ